MKPDNLKTKSPIARFSSSLYIRILLVACIVILSASLASISFGQTTSLNTLVVAKSKVFAMESDTLLVDELILSDSAKLVLTKSNSYIKARKITIGSACEINGIGEPGANGHNGKGSPSAKGLCKSGASGEIGNPGKDGVNGKNLTLDISEFDIHAMVTIDLHAGNGGDGGKGGNGGNGSSTSIHCIANGGNGGAGGNGGNGGNGGTLSILNNTLKVAELATKINLINRGGYRGLGGDGGKGGLRGPGPGEHKSKLGSAGKAGIEGQYGKDGRPLFYSLVKIDNGTSSQSAFARK